MSQSDIVSLATIDKAEQQREQAELCDQLSGFHHDETDCVGHILFCDESQHMRGPEKQAHQSRELKGAYKISAA